MKDASGHSRERNLHSREAGIAAAYARWKHIAERNELCLKRRLVRNRLSEIQRARAGLMVVYGPDFGQVMDLTTRWATTPLIVSPLRRLDLTDALRKSQGKRPVVLPNADVLFESVDTLGLLARAAERTPTFVVRSGRDKETLHLTGAIVIQTSLIPRELPTTKQRLLRTLSKHPIGIQLRADRNVRWECLIVRALFTDWLINSGAQPSDLTAFEAALGWFTTNLWNLEDVDGPALEAIFNRHQEHHAGQLSAALLDLTLKEMKRSAGESPQLPPEREDWLAIRKFYLNEAASAPAAELPSDRGGLFIKERNARR